MFFSSFCLFVFFKQKTAYEMRISDWSSDVCSSDLPVRQGQARHGARRRAWPWLRQRGAEQGCGQRDRPDAGRLDLLARPQGDLQGRGHPDRKSVVQGKSVSVRLDIGGRLIITKKIP